MDILEAVETLCMVEVRRARQPSCPPIHVPRPREPLLELLASGKPAERIAGKETMKATAEKHPFWVPGCSKENSDDNKCKKSDPAARSLNEETPTKKNDTRGVMTPGCQNIFVFRKELAATGADKRENLPKKRVLLVARMVHGAAIYDDASRAHGSQRLPPS